MGEMGLHAASGHRLDSGLDEPIEHRHVEMALDHVGQTIQSSIERHLLRYGDCAPSFLPPKPVEPPTAECALIEDAMKRGAEEASLLKAYSFWPQVDRRTSADFEIGIR